jgi:hypothetical protein
MPGTPSNAAAESLWGLAQLRRLKDRPTIRRACGS